MARSGNPQPYKARLGKRLRGKPGNIAELRLIVWRCVKVAQGCLEEASDPEATLRCIHALSQVAGQYVKLVESSEHEARISVLEKRLADGQSQRPLGQARNGVEAAR